MTVHDTWPISHGFNGRTQTTSRIWPAFGHAILGRGSDDSQMEAHLDFSGSYGHAHADTLSFGLWAFGEELLSDIGYTHTYWGWAGSSLSHNLVVVDGVWPFAECRSAIARTALADVAVYFPVLVNGGDTGKHQMRRAWRRTTTEDRRINDSRADA